MSERRRLRTICKYRHVTERESQYLHDDSEKNLHILCHKGDMVIEPSANSFPLDYDTTRYHGERVVKIDPVAKAWAEHILGFSVDGMEPGNRPDQVCHVIGLTDLPVKLMQKAGHPLPFFIKEPEKGLHPSQQVKIADWSAAMVNNTQEDGSFNVMPTGD